MENLEEDIFGSMSDDSEKVLNDPRKLSKLSVSDVYDADSDSSNKDVRESGSKSVVKVNNSDATAKSLPDSENNNSFDGYFDHIKSKKKKRKKSKEEKSAKHHHHHHNHNRHHSKQEAVGSKTDVSVPPPPPLPSVSSPPPPLSPTPPPSLSLPSLDDTIAEPSPSSELERKLSVTETNIVSGEAIDIVTSSIVEEKVHEEKAKLNDDGQVMKENEESERDRAVQSISNENVDERAVLSIATSLADTSAESIVDAVEEKAKPNEAVEEKTDITISQEETEDAVAAILGESTDFGFNECYPESGEKARPPCSEPELPTNKDADLQSAEPTDEESFLSIDNTKVETQENASDDSDTDSAFTTPCGLSPELSKTDLTLNKSDNDSVLDVTASQAPIETNVDKTKSPSIASPVEEKGNHVEEKENNVREPLPTLPIIKVQEVEVAEVKVNNIEPKLMRKHSSSIEDHDSSKVDILYPSKLPNNISDKCKENVLPVVISEHKPLVDEIKCNGPSVLSAPEIEKIDPKIEKQDAAAKSNDGVCKVRPETVESSHSEESIRVLEEIKTEPREEVSKLDTSTDESLLSEKLEKVDRKVEVDAACLKQKLPIPAQQNTEMSEQRTIDLRHDSCEVNEANKENIVKTIKNQENLSEIMDDTKLSTFMRSKERDVKEISRSVEDELFKSNDFSRCNHKTVENNRNILEKVVQRIHESKRTVQKTEETSIIGEDAIVDKAVLSPEEEMTAEILLKISESSVIQNTVSYNSVVKPNQTALSMKPESKSNYVDSSVDTKKAESSIAEPELEDETSQDFDGKFLSQAGVGTI